MQCFTWNGLEEDFANKIFALAKEGGLANICQNETLCTVHMLICIDRTVK